MYLCKASMAPASCRASKVLLYMLLLLALSSLLGQRFQGFSWCLQQCAPAETLRSHNWCVWLTACRSASGCAVRVQLLPRGMAMLEVQDRATKHGWWEQVISDTDGNGNYQGATARHRGWWRTLLIVVAAFVVSACSWVRGSGYKVGKTVQPVWACGVVATCVTVADAAHHSISYLGECPRIADNMGQGLAHSRFRFRVQVESGLAHLAMPLPSLIQLIWVSTAPLR